MHLELSSSLLLGSTGLTDHESQYCHPQNVSFIPVLCKTMAVFMWRHI